MGKFTVECKDGHETYTSYFDTYEEAIKEFEFRSKISHWYRTVEMKLILLKKEILTK